MNVQTAFGTFAVDCKQPFSEKEKIQLLITAGDEEGEEIKLTVEDVLFKRDQFEVKGRGGLVIYMKDAPRAGQVITVKVQVKCLA